MFLFTSLVSIPIAIGFPLLFVCYYLCRQVVLLEARRRHAKRNNCLPPPSYPHADPVLGLDEIRNATLAAQSKTYLQRLCDQYRQHGNTFAFRLLFSTTIHTIEPENIKAVLSTNFRDFGMGSARKVAFGPLLGESVVVTDGSQWEHSRAMLRPSFARSQVEDLPMLETHTKNLIRAVWLGGPRGETVDLGELFFRFTADVATDFMFGDSINSLIEPDSFRQDFVEAFQAAQVGGEKRWRMGKLLSIVVPQGEFRRSVTHVHEYMNKYIAKAIAYHNSLDTEPATQIEDKGTAKGRYIFLHELAKHTNDENMIRDELLTMFFAGRDTTASLLNNLFFMLARSPSVWERLREEVSQLGGEQPTIEQLKDMCYLRACINECKLARLYPRPRSC